MKVLKLICALLAAPAFSQDLQGNDTAGNWRVTHYESFGIWNSICDERDETGVLVQRCYIRWVDVFSSRPQFAGQFVFITPQADGYRIEFGIEAGTLFSPDGFRIDNDGAISWQTRWPGCLTGLNCVFSGNEAAILLAAMLDGGAFHFAFRDRHGQARNLTWPLEEFGAAWSDFESAAAQRDLLE